MPHDDSGPMADLSPADSDAGKGLSPWLVIAGIVLFLVLLFAVPMLLT